MPILMEDETKFKPITNTPKQSSGAIVIEDESKFTPSPQQPVQTLPPVAPAAPSTTIPSATPRRLPEAFSSITYDDIPKPVPTVDYSNLPKSIYSPGNMTQGVPVQQVISEVPPEPPAPSKEGRQRFPVEDVPIIGPVISKGLEAVYNTVTPRGAVAEQGKERGLIGATAAGVYQGVGRATSLAHRSQGDDATANAILQNVAEYEQAVSQGDAGVQGFLANTYRGALASLITSTTAAVAGGAPGAILFASASEMNSAIQEGQKAGLNGEDLAMYTVRAGLIEATPATVMQALGMGGFEKIVGGLRKSGVPKEAAQTATRGIMAALKQLGVSTVQEVPEEIITEIGHNLNTGLSDVDPSLLTAERMFDTALNTTAQTVMTMGLVNARNIARGTAQSASDAKTAHDVRRGQAILSGLSATPLQTQLEQAFESDKDRKEGIKKVQPIQTREEIEAGVDPSRFSVDIGMGHRIEVAVSPVEKPTTPEGMARYLDSVKTEHFGDEKMMVVLDDPNTPLETKFEEAWRQYPATGGWVTLPNGEQTDVAGLIKLANPKPGMVFNHETLHGALRLFTTDKEFETVTQAAQRNGALDEEGLVNSLLLRGALESGKATDTGVLGILNRANMRMKGFVKKLYGGEKSFNEIARELFEGTLTQRGAVADVAARDAQLKGMAGQAPNVRAQAAPQGPQMAQETPQPVPAQAAPRGPQAAPQPAPTQGQTLSQAIAAAQRAEMMGEGQGIPPAGPMVQGPNMRLPGMQQEARPLTGQPPQQQTPVPEPVQLPGATPGSGVINRQIPEVTSEPVTQEVTPTPSPAISETAARVGEQMRQIDQQQPTGTVTSEDVLGGKTQKETTTSSVVLTTNMEEIPRRRRFEAVTPRGDVRVSGEFQVVDAGSLITSDMEGYDQALQARNRDTLTSRAQIADIAKSPDPTRLMEAPTTDLGAPLVDENWQVISGNGRTMGLREAYATNNAEAYRKAVDARARRYGLSTEGIANPVLVRVMRDTGGSTVKQVADLSNQNQILQMTTAEQAQADADAIGPFLELFQTDESGNIRAASNRSFLTNFVQATHSDNLLNSDGTFSPEIDNRVKRAMLARVFKNSEAGRAAVQNVFENAESLGMKRVLDGVTQAAGRLVTVSELKPQLDLTPSLGKALHEYAVYRQKVADKEVTVLDEYLGQGDMFQERDPVVDTLIQELDIRGRKSATALFSLLDRYGKLAEKVDLDTPDMFTGQVDRTTPQELLDRARQELETESAERANERANARREGRVPGAPRQNAGTGQNVARPENAPAGEGNYTDAQGKVGETEYSTRGETTFFSTTDYNLVDERRFLLQRNQGDPKKAWSSLESMVLVAASNGDTINRNAIESMRRALRLPRHYSQNLFGNLDRVERQYQPQEAVAGDEQGMLFSTLSPEMEAERDFLLKRAGGDTTRAWKIYERMLSAAATRGEPVDPRLADTMRRALLGTGEQADMFGEANKKVIRFTDTTGRGLLNNQALDRTKLTDDEETELDELMGLGLQQPIEGTKGTFYFTKEGERKNKRLIELLYKASRNGVVRKEYILNGTPIWESDDGQVAINSYDVIEAAPEKEKRTFTKPVERPVQQSLEGLDEGMLFSTAPPEYQPKKTEIRYKLLQTKRNNSGKISWLFIGKDQEIPIGKWLIAENLPTKGFKQRPGFHTVRIPSAEHLKSEVAEGPRVVAEVEIPADVDWQTEASASKTKDLTNKIPENGYYTFPRPKRQGGEWTISGAIKINRILSEAEVQDILKQRDEGTLFSTVYHRGKDPRTTDKVTVQWADNAERIRGYGVNQYELDDKHLADIPEWLDGFVEEYYRKTLGDDYYKYLPATADPKDIVDSADVWDDADFVTALWDKHHDKLTDMMDSGKFGFRTQNGAVTFPDTRIPATKEGMLYSTAQTGTPEFKRWFGDSKVVDADGKPLVVYHGTNANFYVFSKDAESKHIPLPGFFFTPESWTASRFAESAAREFRDEEDFIEGYAGANVMPVYLSIKNPAYINVAENGEYQSHASPDIVKQKLNDAQKEGYDGAVITGWADGSGDIQYVAFSPTQIKSATGNRGTFDPTNPDIRYSTANLDSLSKPERDRYTDAAFAAMYQYGADEGAYKEALRSQFGDRIDPYVDDLREMYLNRRREGLQRAQAAAKQGPEPVGRPDLANFGETPEAKQALNQVDQARNEAGKPDHIPRDVTRDKAELMIAEDREGTIAALMAKGMRMEPLTPEETRAGTILFNEMAQEAIASGDLKAHERAQEFADALRESRSAWGRAGVEMQVPKTPEEKANVLLQYAMSPSHTLQARIDAVNKRLKGRMATGASSAAAEKQMAKLRGQQAKQVQKRLDWLKKLGYDLTPQGLESMLGDEKLLARFMADVSTDRSSLADKLHELRISSMLSWVTTHQRNVLSAVAYQALDTYVQRGVEMAVNSLPGIGGHADAAQWGEIGPIMIRSIQALPGGPLFKMALKNAMRAFSMETEQLSQQVLGETLPEKIYSSARLDSWRGPAIKGAKGRAIRTPLRSLMFEDELLKTIYASIDVGAQAHRIAKAEKTSGKKRKDRMRELINDPTSDAWKAAFDTASRLMFHDQQMGKYIKGRRWVLPFVKTPLAVFRTTVRKAGGSGIALLADYSRGETGDMKVRHAAETILAIVGATTLYGMLGGDDDDDLPWITGANPRHGSRMEYSTEAYEIPKNAFRAGNTWYDYTNFGPLGDVVSLLVTGIEALGHVKNGDDLSKASLEAWGSFMREFARHPMLTGLNDLVDAFESPDRFVRFWQNFAGSFSPNIVKGPMRATDEAVRDKKDMTIPEGFGYAAFPFREGLPAKIDVWGKEVLKGGSTANRLFNVFRPIKEVAPPDSIEGKLNQLIRTWNSNNPDDKFTPKGPVGRSITEGGKTYDLTAEQFETYRKKAGRYAVEALKKSELNFRRPKRADIDKIDDVLRESRTKARKEMLSILRRQKAS